MDPTNGKLVGRKAWALMLTKGSCRVRRLSRATYLYKQTILSMTPRRSGSVLSDFLTNRGQCDQRTHCAEGDIPPRRENTSAWFHEDRGHEWCCTAEQSRSNAVRNRESRIAARASAELTELDVSGKPADWFLRPDKELPHIVKGAQLKQADLRHASAQKAFLVRANLRGAQLNKADLSEAQLQGADLSQAQLQGGN